MKEQTAVEWLAEQIKDYDCSPISNNEDYAIVIPIWIFKSKVEEAKEMESEQLYESYLDGMRDESER